jgi:hypothetical protein
MDLKQTRSPNCSEDACNWTPILHRYRDPDHVRSMLEVLVTAVPFGTGRLTLLQSFGRVRLALWDETRRRLISFHELRASSVRVARTTVIERVSEGWIKRVDPSQ